MNEVKVNIKKLSENAKIPTYQTGGSAGFDVHSLNDVSVYPNQIALVPTGLSFEIPEGYELQIRPRSGLSLRSKLRIANSPGTIDSDYRGHVQIIVENISNNPAEHIQISAGDRIAQFVLNRVERAVLVEEIELSDTERGQGGFGSTNDES